MKVLGISCYYHDSAAALVIDGKIIAAVQEERFTRKKHDSRFPHFGIQYCLAEANIDLREVDRVVFYDKPFLKFERLIETYLAFAPRGLKSFSTSLPSWVKEKLFQKKLIKKELSRHLPGIDIGEKLMFAEHHQSHAASAFYPSPFENAAVLTMDGVGEWATTSVAIGDGNSLQMMKEINFPHSIGLLYSAFTFYTGFKVNSGEYKVMGLAPYGRPKFAQKILDHLIDVKDDGSFRLNMKYFNYCAGTSMTNEKFSRLFDLPVRNPECDEISQCHMDLAASIQSVTEEVIIKLARGIKKEYGQEHLCLAGGVALNCVANGKLARKNIFKDIWIQPAAGDAGGALGAALLGSHHYFGEERRQGAGDSMSGSFLGPKFGQSEIEERLNALGAKYHRIENDEEFLDKTAALLAEQKVIGWHQGRMEYGPRALGSRSIISDPRSSSMQRKLNLKIKFRESFRPFAPSILRDDVSEWFEHQSDSPYMLFVAPVSKEKRIKLTLEEEELRGVEKLKVVRSEIPAVTHVDNSARIQTVHPDTNQKYYKLISKFKEKTGCPIVINTSFNVRGEPIVCTPQDSFRCFMGTDMDVLAIGNCLLFKEEQNLDLVEQYHGKFEAD